MVPVRETVTSNTVVYCNFKNTVSLCMWCLMSQEITMMQWQSQLFTVKRNSSIILGGFKVNNCTNDKKV